ncbi:GYD domain-containing protein [Haladaptatus caseinilyticus]|uniref:GYD domain-containing protein n=1 Tax=Haladaptatus caseinilyticus TaxID=2993314 RepID=UPI00224A983B|nr:GYD domain-containing protein [Haladaptatus caseinilyticus]
MAKYVSLVKIRGSVQNPQKLASSLGNLASEVDEYDAGIVESYAILGEYDFMVVFDAPDRNAAFRASIAIENQGLDAQTMEIIPIEEFANIVQE